ncbi:MAG TPA: aminotransferase class V-fold PLP-dependent enzyme [Gemmatimonadaceae bacterium]|nr:aminotransferase class V-fold PLP-dependent enzyme [Gemmatimonadaceae bacterium]
MEASAGQDGSSPAYDLVAWRQRIPLIATRGLVPMNNCSQAPQTDLTRAAAERYLDSWNSSGMDWDAWMEEVRLAKEAFAGLIHASAGEIAVFSSVSEAASAVASALDFGGHRRDVVVSEAEFPTVGQVWLAQERRGARVTWVPVRDGAVEGTEYDARIDERTMVVSACHGYYLNGFTQDIARIAKSAHTKGALLFVDAYQTLGAMPVDVHALDADFLVAGNLKYLMGIPGIAFLYVRRALIDSLRPAVTGWFGRTDPFAFRVKELDWSPTASRFDTGTPPLINAYVARAGMEIIAAIGPGTIHAWHTVLARRLIDGGRARGLVVHGPTDAEHKTASTAFLVRDAHGVEAAMRDRGVLSSARGPVIRLAPHFYSSLDDVDTALDVLAGVVLRS